MSWFNILKSSAITADFILDVFNVRDENDPEFWVGGMQGWVGNFGAEHQSNHGKSDKLYKAIGEAITKHGYVTFASYGDKNFSSHASYWRANKDYKTQIANYGSTRESPLNLYAHSMPIAHKLMQTKEFRNNILPIAARSYFSGNQVQAIRSERKRAATEIASALNRLIDEEVNALNKSLISGTNTGSTSANPGNSILLESVRNLSSMQQESFFQNVGKKIDDEAEDWVNEWKKKMRDEIT